MAHGGSLGAGELAKKGRAWCVYYPRGSTLYPPICGSGDVGVGGRCLRPIREARGEVSVTTLNYIFV